MRAAVGAFALLAIAVAGTAQAQATPDYPRRPVRFIVAQSPGGNADFVARMSMPSVMTHVRRSRG